MEQEFLKRPMRIMEKQVLHLPEDWFRTNGHLPLGCGNAGPGTAPCGGVDAAGVQEFLVCRGHVPEGFKKGPPKRVKRGLLLKRAESSAVLGVNVGHRLTANWPCKGAAYHTSAAL